MRKEDKGVYLVNGNRIVSSEEKHLLTGIGFTEAELKTAKEGTMAWSILKAHNTSSDMENLRLKFDALVSLNHDMIWECCKRQCLRCGRISDPLCPYKLS